VPSRDDPSRTEGWPQPRRDPPGPQCATPETSPDTRGLGPTSRPTPNGTRSTHRRTVRRAGRADPLNEPPTTPNTQPPAPQVAPLPSRRRLGGAGGGGGRLAGRRPTGPPPTAGGALRRSEALPSAQARSSPGSSGSLRGNHPADVTPVLCRASRSIPRSQQRSRVRCELPRPRVPGRRAIAESRLDTPDTAIDNGRRPT